MQSRLMLWQLRALGAVALFAAAVAQAEPIPAEYLEIERKSCNQSCARENASAQWCKRYCDCNIAKMKARISYQEYAGVETAAIQDAPQSPGAIDKLTDIFTSCAKETQ